MGAEFAIRQQVDSYGIFWKPNDPDKKFTGRLIRDELHHLELITSPEYRSLTLDDMATVFNEAQGDSIGVLHGLVENEPCTLFGLYSPSLGGTTNMLELYAISYRKYRVSFCVIGLHLPDESSPLLTAGYFVYSGLKEWVPRRPEIEHTSESITHRYSRNVPAILDVSSLRLRSRIRLSILCSWHHSLSGECTTTNIPQLTVEPTEPHSAAWFIDLAYHLENLFSVLLGTSVHILNVGLKHGDKTGWCVRPGRDKLEKTDVSICVRGDASHVAAALVNWLSTSEELRPFENLVYGTIRNSSLYVETEFLSLAQGLEAFHRLTDSGRNASFQKRIKKLLSRINPQNCQRLVGDQDMFEQTLRQTRNYFTHPGIEREARVLTDAGGLFLFNQKMHALLRLLVLKNLGFSEELAFEPIYQRLIKYRALT